MENLIETQQRYYGNIAIKPTRIAVFVNPKQRNDWFNQESTLSSKGQPFEKFKLTYKEAQEILGEHLTKTVKDSRDNFYWASLPENYYDNEVAIKECDISKLCKYFHCHKMWQEDMIFMVCMNTQCPIDEVLNWTWFQLDLCTHCSDICLNEYQKYKCSQKDTVAKHPAFSKYDVCWNGIRFDRALKRAAESCGLNYIIGIESIPKTQARHLKETLDIELGGISNKHIRGGKYEVQ